MQKRTISPRHHSGADNVFGGQAMKFKFSIRSLFITTTIFSLLMAIAVWLDLISQWRFFSAIALYIVIYLGVVVLIFGPRYARELMEFREKRSNQRLVRAKLEEEASMILAAAKSKQQEQQDEDGPDKVTQLD